jgi:hypothetical protein
VRGKVSFKLKTEKKDKTKKISIRIVTWRALAIFLLSFGCNLSARSGSMRFSSSNNSFSLRIGRAFPKESSQVEHMGIIAKQKRIPGDDSGRESPPIFSHIRDSIY